MMLIEVVDSLIDPEGSRLAPVPFWTAPDGNWYRVYLYLRGPDLPLIRRAHYHLPSEEYDPSLLRIERRSFLNPFFKVSITTQYSGTDIVADITRVRRLPNRIQHTLRYDREFSSPDFPGFKCNGPYEPV